MCRLIFISETVLLYRCRPSCNLHKLSEVFEPGQAAGYGRIQRGLPRGGLLLLARDVRATEGGADRHRHTLDGDTRTAMMTDKESRVFSRVLSRVKKRLSFDTRAGCREQHWLATKKGAAFRFRRAGYFAHKTGDKATVLEIDGLLDLKKNDADIVQPDLACDVRRRLSRGRDQSKSSKIPLER